MVTILALDKTNKVIARRDMGSMVVAPPVYANATLYVLTEGRLFAIGEPKR